MNSDSFRLNWCRLEIVLLAWREVVVDDVVRDVPDQNHLEAGQAVVAERASHEDAVLLAQLFDLDAVVQHDRSEEENQNQIIICDDETFVCTRKDTRDRDLVWK